MNIIFAQIPIIVLSLLPFECLSQETYANTPEFKHLSQSETTEDINVFKRVLETFHPGLFLYQTVEEFETTIMGIIEFNKNGLSEWELFKELLKTTGNIKDAHTTLLLDSESDSDRYWRSNQLPVSVKIIDAQIYIVDCFSLERSELKGAEILSINNIKSKELMSQLKQYVYVDGNNSAEEAMLGKQFPSILQYHFGFELSYDLKLRLSTGKKVSTSIKAINRENWLTPNNELTNSDSVVKDYQLTFIDSIQTSILTLNSFYHEELEEFLKTSFQEIRDNNTQHLIIDIRNNYGGYDEVGAELFSYLVDSTWHYYDYMEANIWTADNPLFKYSNLPKAEIDTLMTQLILEENRQIVNQDGFELLDSVGISNNLPFYSGKCYLLLNEYCFSGATEFATTFKVYNRGLIIGRETGGGFGVNCSGWLPTFTLPNSGIRVNVPLFKYVSQTYGELYDGGIVPDIKIKECAENIFKQEDMILNKALQQIELEGFKKNNH